MPYLPQLHSQGRDARVRGLARRRGGSWLVEHNGAPWASSCCAGVHVEQLYVHPAHQRSGIGSRLLRPPWPRTCARTARASSSRRNNAAREFYAAHLGFSVARLSDGAGNEEREPDALLVRAAGAAEAGAASGRRPRRGRAVRSTASPVPDARRRAESRGDTPGRE